MTEATSKPSVPKAGLIVLAIVAIVVGALIMLPPNDIGDDPGPAQTEKKLAHFVELKNVGIAHLENNDLDEAEKCFEELIEFLPENRLPRQNLAIVRLMKIAPETLSRSEDPVRFDRRRERARQAVQHLLERFPDNPQVHVLASRLETGFSVGDSGKAIEALQRAAELSPHDAAIWFGIYDAGRYSRNDDLIAVANKALEKAWELSQDNLYVMREWLTAQARGKDPNVGETLLAAKKLVAPFVDRIRTFGGVDLNDLLDQGIVALPKDDWNTVIRSAIMSGNMLRPEVATQNDAKKVTPHLLEFIVNDFDSEFYVNKSIPQSPFPDAIPLNFTLTKTPFQNLENVRQVHIVDFDLDRNQDVVIVQSDRLSVWTLNPLKYRDWTMTTLLEMSSSGLPTSLTGACLFDLDRDAAVVEHESAGKTLMCADADLDIVAFGQEGIVVLRNELVTDGGQTGGRVLVPMEQSQAMAALKAVLAVLPVDFDHDGDLDLVVSADTGVSLWLNRDDSTFVEHSKYSILPPVDTGIHTMIAVDWDRNVSIDILAFGSQKSGILRNLLHGQLRWESFPDDSSLSGPVIDAAILDADANFSWDIAAVPVSGGKSDVPPPTLFTTANPDAGVVRFLESELLSPVVASGLASADFDNDGFIDIMSWNGDSLTLHRGGPLAQFQTVADTSPTLPSEVKSLSIADIDSDGDIDLIAVCQSSVELLINNGGNANNWIDIPIRAEDAKQAQKPNERVNIHGVGSLLELRSGTAYQPQVVTGWTTHFGLGKLEQADAARVLWTNGIPEHIVNPKHGEPICLQQHLKGSCPYLYTWDGEKFAFYTDCLWAAPIGLQLAEGILAPPREWEYLKIDGDQLKAKDGEYVLKLTEELWEIG
ncbi:MAG: FG-GAP-like repeat-containing protein, partial [Planctomycetota bacterium]|nr:FG-GAP-like repeat-containing protein [Planctomycetota bacterium]